MNRPRVPLGLEATRATLNRAVCLQVGSALAAARREQDLSIQAVGSRLLLSPTQVTALEEVNADAFYSAEFYGSALKKYAALLAIEPDQLDRVIVGPEQTDTSSPATPKRGRKTAEAPLIRVRPRRAAMAAAAVIVGGLASWAIVSSFRSTPVRPANATLVEPADEQVADVQSSSAPVSPVTAAPVVEPVVVKAVNTTAGQPLETPTSAIPLAEATSASDVFGRVRVDAPTWIFVRYINNATSERGLAAGDEFVLRQRPTYLAIGTAQAASVEIAGRAVDTTAYSANGQLRIGAASLASLIQRAPALP